MWITLLFGATHFLDVSVGGVQVEGSEAVTQEESIHGIITIEVVNTKGEFSLYEQNNQWSSSPIRINKRQLEFQCGFTPVYK